MFCSKQLEAECYLTGVLLQCLLRMLYLCHLWLHSKPKKGKC